MASQVENVPDTARMLAQVLARVDDENTQALAARDRARARALALEQLLNAHFVSVEADPDATDAAKAAAARQRPARSLTQRFAVDTVDVADLPDATGDTVEDLDAQIRASRSAHARLTREVIGWVTAGDRLQQQCVILGLREN